MTWDRLHEEDILFEFRGDQPDELTPGRFYRGTVDGFADFGVFIELGSGVTGLLHRSRLDQRLESLDWDVGDEVIVQVEGIRDNGNVDLDWSLRQSPREFRGHDIDPPSAADEDMEADDETEPEPEPAKAGAEEPSEEATPATDAEPEPVSASAIARETIENVPDHIGERVRIEGRITEIHQTSGPTIFSVVDETGTVDCAAFESAGVRAYPGIEVDDLVTVLGLADRHRGEIQIEAETIESLPEDQRAEVLERLDSAARERARPNDASQLIVDPAVTDLREEMIATATRLRRAVFAGQRILIRHPATADGVIAGAAIERAITKLHDEVGSDGRRIVERRPMDDRWYDLGDAMYDRGATTDETPPLIALVGAGTSQADRSALRFLQLYDVPTVAIDAFPEGELPTSLVDAGVLSASDLTATVVAAHVAGMIEETVRDDIVTLPAISYRDSAPDRYEGVATEQGLDPDTARQRHEAIALTAYYQRFDDKRELVADLLFDSDADDLADHVSTQYRERIETAINTAQENADRIEAAGRTVTLLDAEAHSHRFDFPPRDILAEELYRAERDAGHGDVIVVFDRDHCYIHGTTGQSRTELADRIGDRIPDAGVQAKRDRLSYLAGRQDAVRQVLIEELSP